MSNPPADDNHSPRNMESRQPMAQNGSVPIHSVRPTINFQTPIRYTQPGLNSNQLAQSTGVSRTVGTVAPQRVRVLRPSPTGGRQPPIRQLQGTPQMQHHYPGTYAYTSSIGTMSASGTSSQQHNGQTLSDRSSSGQTQTTYANSNQAFNAMSRRSIPQWCVQQEHYYGGNGHNAPTPGQHYQYPNAVHYNSTSAFGPSNYASNPSMMNRSAQMTGYQNMRPQQQRVSKMPTNMTRPPKLPRMMLPQNQQSQRGDPATLSVSTGPSDYGPSAGTFQNSMFPPTLQNQVTYQPVMYGSPIPAPGVPSSSVAVASAPTNRPRKLVIRNSAEKVATEAPPVVVPMTLEEPMEVDNDPDDVDDNIIDEATIQEMLRDMKSKRKTLGPCFLSGLSKCTESLLEECFIAAFKYCEDRIRAANTPEAKIREKSLKGIKKYYAFVDNAAVNKFQMNDNNGKSNIVNDANAAAMAAINSIKPKSKTQAPQKPLVQLKPQLPRLLYTDLDQIILSDSRFERSQIRSQVCSIRPYKMAEIIRRYDENASKHGKKSDQLQS